MVCGQQKGPLSGPWWVAWFPAHTAVVRVWLKAWFSVPPCGLRLRGVLVPEFYKGVALVLVNLLINCEA